MKHHGTVVVGLGDADGGVPELDWSAADAATRHVQVHIVRTYQLAQSTVPWDSSFDRSVSSELRARAHRRLEDAVTHVRSAWPDVTVTGEVVSGRASEILRGDSSGAAITVVGSRRFTAFDSAIIGSTGSELAATAASPVVIVRGPGGNPAEDPAVVVGVDGSAMTEEVLAFAFDHASRHQRRVRAVFCWPPDVLAGMQWRAEPPAPERAERWLAEALTGWSERYPDVPVHRAVLRQHPVAGLVAAAAAQDLVVVGSHAGHPRLAALLGSVAQGVLHHADCPVAIVPSRSVGPSRRP